MAKVTIVHEQFRVVRNLACDLILPEFLEVLPELDEMLINNYCVLGLDTPFNVGGHLVCQGRAEAPCVEIARLVLRELVVQLRGHIEVSLRKATTRHLREYFVSSFEREVGIRSWFRS